MFEAILGIFVPENCSVYAQIRGGGGRLRSTKFWHYPHFSWIFRDGFPLAQMEEQRYEEQKKEEEAEKRYQQDFDNWLAKYKETSKKWWWNQCVWLKQCLISKFFLAKLSKYSHVPFKYPNWQIGNRAGHTRLTCRPSMLIVFF